MGNFPQRDRVTNGFSHVKRKELERILQCCTFIIRVWKSDMLKQAKKKREGKGAENKLIRSPMDIFCP